MISFPVKFGDQRDVLQYVSSFYMHICVGNVQCARDIECVSLNVLCALLYVSANFIRAHVLVFHHDHSRRICSTNTPHSLSLHSVCIHVCL